jgi:hypothetical protein
MNIAMAWDEVAEVEALSCFVDEPTYNYSYYATTIIRYDRPGYLLA